MKEIEARGYIQSKLNCMNKCDVFEREHSENKDLCDSCEYCYSQGNFGNQKEAIQIVIQALEKQMPKKPKEKDCIGFNTLACPGCKMALYSYEPYCDKLRTSYRLELIYVTEIQNCISCVEEQPTAYSVDKVVEELKKIKGLACDDKKCSECEYTSYCFEGEQSEKVAIDKAIEIVKQGGVSDDMCEWTQSGDMAISPHTFSKYKIKQCDGLYALSTCSYCRKQIKVVE